MNAVVFISLMISVNVGLFSGFDELFIKDLNLNLILDSIVYKKYFIQKFQKLNEI